MSWKCPVCKLKIPYKTAKRVQCICGYFDKGDNKLRGFGDWLARLFYSVGLTPKRYLAWQFWKSKEKRKCFCAERQFFFNKLFPFNK